MEIIPAIDVIDGKCVRLTRGNYAEKKIYNEKPLEVALAFEEAGIRRLHLVDLDGARMGEVRNWKVLETIATRTSLLVDFGGGIKSEKDVTVVFNSGAALATVGSVAVKSRDDFLKWVKKYGTEKFFLGADVKNEKIAIQGWKNVTDITVHDFIRDYFEEGLKYIFCTDIDKDGMLEGPATDLYKKILKKFPELKLVASGGISSLKDVDEIKLAGCSGVIIGKAIYEGRVQLIELKSWILNYAN
jgi:phosphoribosylformimino-5-aminoimidazole carboxamide ribotide isomerase